MKIKVTILASFLLGGCEMSRNDAVIPTLTQYSQSLSAPIQKANSKYSNIVISTPWQDDEPVLTSDKNLWKYIRDELNMKIPENARIREQKNKYLKGKSYLYNTAQKAEPYMYWIVAEVQQRKMPMELVLLPIVESAFNPHATSSANAAGIWQILSSTAKNYGLKQNKWYDGRRDFVASTKAALDMMQYLNKMFKGDWLLTVAAYNSGEGRILKAIKRNKLQKKATDFWNLSLPRETAIYVPKMLALSDIIKNSKHYGLTLPVPDKNHALTRIDVGQQIQLTQAAKMAGIPLAKIKNYNSGYIRGTTAPEGPHYIMIPKSRINYMRDSLIVREFTSNQSKFMLASGDTNAIPLRNKTLTPLLRNSNSVSKNRQSTVATIITYRVRKGDSLTSIARHHGLNPTDVKRWNPQFESEKSLKPGNELTLHVVNENPIG